jgi:MarR family transcriptional regulator, transcriptional regulator for hemolysin
MSHDNKSFAYPLVDVTRLFRKHFDRRAEPQGLTRAQWRALKAIHRQEGLSQKALAELLEMEPIPIGRVVDRLQQAGFVERRADPADRRCWRLYLTDKALGVVDAMEVISAGLRDDALHNVEENDFNTFIRVLGLMKQNLLALDEIPTTLQDSP